MFDDNILEEESLYPIENFKLTTTPNDFNILTIISFLNAGVFVIPDFQRNYVWDINKASKLIESLLIGLPIPQMFLYEESRNKFYIIDGQQRLLSIYFFVHGRFPKNNEARLKLKEQSQIDNHFIDYHFLNDDNYFTNFSLRLDSRTNPNNNKFHDKEYNTLDKEDKTTLDLATIRNMIIKPSMDNRTNNIDAMFEIFNRLNSGGINLNHQEIRMSLYYSNFLNELLKMNKEKIWRNKLGKEIPDLRLTDVEMILRLFSMLFSGYEGIITRYKKLVEYQNSIIGFLNSTAKVSKEFTIDQIFFFSELWKEFLSKWNAIDVNFNFSEEKTNISITFLESVFYAVCYNTYCRYMESKYPPDLDKDIKLDRNFILKLKENNEFKQAATGKTTSKENVSKRLRLAYEIHQKCYFQLIHHESSVQF